MDIKTAGVDFLKRQAGKFRTGEPESPADTVARLLVVIHPVWILFALYNFMSEQPLRYVLGNIFFGVLLGLGLLRLMIRYRFEMRLKKSLIFLIAPIVLCLLSCIKSVNPVVPTNSNLVWLCFAAVLLISGARLFALGNADIDRGNADIDRGNVDADRGNVDADRGNRRDPETLAVAFFVPALLFFFFVCFLSSGPGFSPDSLSYYDISRGMFKGFGQVATVRQYVIFTDLNISFPYLYPLVIAIVDGLTGFGIYSGVIINALAAVFTLFLLMRGTKRLCGSAIPGMLAALMLFSSVDYMGEVMAARAVPMAILCMALLFNVLAKLRECTRRDIFLAGLFAGAGVMVRFDFLVVAGITGIALLPMYKKNVFKMAPVYLLGLLVFTAPWILYSLVNFHTPWVTDNGSTLFMIHAHIPQRVFTPDEIVPTLFNDMEGWLGKVRGSYNGISTGIFNMIIEPQNLLLLGFSVFGMTAGAFLKRDTQTAPRNKGLRWLILGAGIAYLLKTAVIIMVGYGDLRYHPEAVLVFFLLALCAGYRSCGDAKMWLRFTALAAAFMMVLNLAPKLDKDFKSKMHRPPFTESIIKPPVSDTEWIEKLREDSGKTRNEDIKVFFVDGDPFGTGAFSRLNAYGPLDNITEERLLYLVQEFIRPAYIHATQNSEQWIEVLKTIYDLTLIDGANTYRVESKK